MKLLVNVIPEYFSLLDFKHVEFRQIESIVLENSKTHETREFTVKDIRKCERPSAEHVQKTFPLVPWNEDLPIFAIELGDEISVLPKISAAADQEDRKKQLELAQIYEDDGALITAAELRRGVRSVPAGAKILEPVPDRKEITYEKPWYAVGD